MTWDSDNLNAPHTLRELAQDGEPAPGSTTEPENATCPSAGVSEPLLPCPFCGGEAVYTSRRRGSPGAWGVDEMHWVYCSSQDCLADFGMCETADEAIAGWNRRPASPSEGGFRGNEVILPECRMLFNLWRSEPARAPKPLAVTNCCVCGRIVDTREVEDGGDDFGCELSDGRWVCSGECCDIACPPPRELDNPADLAAAFTLQAVLTAIAAERASWPHAGSMHDGARHACDAIAARIREMMGA